MDALVLVGAHVKSIAEMDSIEILDAASAGTAVPADALQMCAFFRVWCLVELASALQSNTPVVMVVGNIDAAGRFVPMGEMLENLYHLVTITKATASNPADLDRELCRIEQTLGFAAMDTLVRGAITGARQIEVFPEVMRAACGQGEDGMARAFGRMKPATRDAALFAASAAGFVPVIKSLLACGAKVNAAEKKGGRMALMMAAHGGHTAAIDALVAKGAEVNAADKIGDTALMAASGGGHRPAIEALVAKGAKVQQSFDALCPQSASFPRTYAGTRHVSGSWRPAYR